MAHYLKRVALRGAGVVERVHQVPFIYDPFAFSGEAPPEDLAETGTVEQDTSLREQATSESIELPQARPKTIERPSQELTDQSERIVVRERPSFPMDEHRREQSVKEDISHKDSEREVQSKSIGEVEKSLPHQVQFDSIPRPTIGKKHEESNERKVPKTEPKIVDNLLHEPVDRSQEITTYEIPSFTDDKITHEKSAPETSLSDLSDGTGRKVKLEGHTEEETILPPPIRVDTIPTLTERRTKIGRDEREDREIEPRVIDKIGEEVRGPKETSSKIEQAGSEKTGYAEPPETTEEPISYPSQHETIGTKTDYTVRRKVKNGKSTLPSIGSATERKSSLTKSKSERQEIVRAEPKRAFKVNERELTPRPKAFNRYLGLDNGREKASATETGNGVSVASVPKPKVKESPFQSSGVTSELPRQTPVTGARTKAEPKPGTTEVKVSVGKLEVSVEGARKVMVSSQKSGDGLERYYLQRNYLRIT